MLKLKDSKSIGETLKNCRQNKGQNLICAANGIGITPTALSNYENGIRIPRDEIKASISNYYNRSITDIFFEHTPTKRE